MFDWNQIRRDVLVAAAEGRATYLPAGARHNATALIFVDGVEVGQASVVGHYVRAVDGAARHGEVALVPGYRWALPEGLRHLAA